MFKTRLISGIVLVILLLFFGIMGGYLLLGGVAVVSMIGLYEFYRVFGLEKDKLGYAGYLSCVLFYGLQLSPLGREAITFLSMLILFFLLMGIYVFTFPKYEMKHLMPVFFGFFYVAVMLSCVFWLRCIYMGKYLIWLIFIWSWGCDTCAYCVGMLFGKHKMAPVLSPKKSIEGAVGGILGTGLLTCIFCLIFKDNMGISWMLILLLVLFSMVGAFLSMIGDLAASAIKRNHGVKDYGRLIPGHGGVLDRFDSVIVTAPIIYVFVAYLL